MCEEDKKNKTKTKKTTTMMEINDKEGGVIIRAYSQNTNLCTSSCWISEAFFRQHRLYAISHGLSRLKISWDLHGITKAQNVNALNWKESYLFANKVSFGITSSLP